MFLITGCGRSGTKYIAIALQRSGLDVGHERMGNDGIVSAFYCLDVNQYPGKHSVPRPEFNLILHQVREPLETIASLQTGKSWGWICKFQPIDIDAPLLKRCCYHWLMLSEEAERQAVLTYRIESLEDEWPTLQRLIGFEAPYSAIANLPRTVNARKHDDITWSDVKQAAPEIYDDIRAAANRYGYR